MTMKYYKCLNGLEACHGGDYTYELGVWTPEIEDLEEWNEKTARLFAVWCARQVQHLMGDDRSIAALDVAERFVNGEATEEELADAAWDAARAADAAGTARTKQVTKLKEMLGIN